MGRPLRRNPTKAGEADPIEATIAISLKTASHAGAAVRGIPRREEAEPGIAEVAASSRDMEAAAATTNITTNNPLRDNNRNNNKQDQRMLLQPP